MRSSWPTLAFVALAACAAAPLEPAELAVCPDGTDTPAAILARSCTAFGCHGSDTPAAGLDLASPGIGGRLVDHAGGGCGGRRIDAQAPQASLILTKLGRDPACGEPMPLGAPALPAAARACLAAWVDDVATEVSP
jgi:hypothetical protein